MSGITLGVTLVLIVLFMSAMATILVALVLRHCGGVGEPRNLGLLVLGRAGHGQETNWEPFVVAPGDHDHAGRYVTPDELAQRVADHIAVDHAGLPSAADWTALVRRVETLEQQHEQNRTRIARLERIVRRLHHVRIASQRPYEVFGALIGTAIGIVVAAAIPSRLYSYPTITKVYVSNHTTIQHQLAQDHWVLGGIVVAGLLVGLVLGLAAKYIFGRTETVAVDEANEAEVER